MKKDINSFLFINDNESNNFIHFTACENTVQHINISDRIYICHGNTSSLGDGIRTFHRNFDSVEYCLPSNTFTRGDGDD